MTSDAATTQPKKRSWKRLIVVLGCVVAVTTIVLLAFAPKKEPVKVWFVRATNEMGEKKLVFQVTNGIDSGIEFGAIVGLGAIPQVVPRNWNPTTYDKTNTVMPAGTNWCFTLSVPTNGAAHYVAWGFYSSSWPDTPWERLRLKCYAYLRDHNKPRLAARFWPDPNVHFIPSTEIKE